MVFVVAGNEVAGKIAPIDRINRRKQFAVARGVELHAVVAYELERDGRVRQCDFLHYIAYRVSLGDVLLHELCSCGDVVEEVADNNGRAVGTAALFVRLLHASFNRVQRAVLVLAALCHDLHSRDCRHRGESLSAEAEGADIVKVIFCNYLAGGVSEKSRRHVLERHAASVVSDAHIRSAAVLYLDGDMARARVYGVLHELLYDGGGTLYDLARGDELGYLLAQNIYMRHCFLLSICRGRIQSARGNTIH